MPCLLYSITRTIFGDEYRAQNPMLCSLLQSPVTSSLLGPIQHHKSVTAKFWSLTKLPNDLFSHANAINVTTGEKNKWNPRGSECSFPCRGEHRYTDDNLHSQQNKKKKQKNASLPRPEGWYDCDSNPIYMFGYIINVLVSNSEYILYIPCLYFNNTARKQRCTVTTSWTGRQRNWRPISVEVRDFLHSIRTGSVFCGFLLRRQSGLCAKIAAHLESAHFPNCLHGMVP
jgi:hypothetical protein